MSPQERSQIHNFILQARESGTPDTEIMSFLANKGVLSAVNPEKYGTSSLAVETATPTIGGRQLNQGFAPVDPMAMNQQEPQRQGFFSRVGDRLQNRGSRIAEQVSPEAAATANPLRRGMRIAGDVIGAGLDVVGEGLVTAARGIGTTANIATAPTRGVASLFGAPDAVTAKPTEQLKTLANKIAESPLGEAAFQALGSGVEQWEQFAEQNPEVARDLQALGNIVSVLPIGTAAQSGGRLARQTRLGQGGEALRQSADATDLVRQSDYVQNLVTPELRGRKLPDGVRLTDIQEGGLISERRIVPSSASDRQIIETVSNIPDVSPNNTVLANGQAMERYIGREAENLVAKLQQNDVIFPKRELVAALNRTSDELKKTPTLTGDAGRSADRVMQEYIRRIDAADGKMSEVLQIRKDLDRWVANFAGDKALSGERVNAVSIAARELRDTVNEYLITKSPVGSEVRDSLQRQTNTFRALDNVTPKALAESKNSLSRGLDTLSSALGTRSKIVQGLALLSGIGTFGAMTAYAPVATGAILGGAGLVGIYRVAVSPTSRRRIADLLDGIEGVLPTLPANQQAPVRETIDVLIGLGIIGAREIDPSEQPESAEVQ